METFLKAVAYDLYDKFGGDLSHTAVIFPNKRAGLFFNRWLAERSERPVWTPVYLTVSDLFRRMSTLQVGDPIKLTCLLHRIFCEETGSTETLDSFYFWGEMLIADFDDLDKNMVEADRLFRNLADLKELTDDHSYLTKEQEEALRLFFKNFSIEHTTELKQSFSRLWSALGGIYHRFRQKLEAEGIAYEGQLYRKVVEQTTAEAFPFDRYVFVGFNVLNQVETRLFRLLQKSGKALFYWDYDEFYVNNQQHEAGEFLRRNLKEFPNALSDLQLFRNLSKEKVVDFIESPTENAQARYVPQWLSENLTPQENETAVVLCNEVMLQSVLHALPSEGVKSLNVTMGYPLAQTPVYSLLTALIDLYTTGYNTRTGRYYYRQVNALLKHPYVRRLSPHTDALEHDLASQNRFFPTPAELQRDEVLTRIFPTDGIHTVGDCCRSLLVATETLTGLFKESDTCLPDEQLQQEAVFRCYTQLNRFCKLVEDGDLDVTLPTLSRLLKRVLGTLSVPFHGEPAIGLQVMGVLETRCLDFKHLLMLSVNEGKLPKAEGDSSFIPYNLRRAFGMTTIEHKNAVYAYYFYRLMQRAERVTLVYNSSADGLNRGEMSRFMLQYLIEGSRHSAVRRYVLTAGQRLASPLAFTPRLLPDTSKLLRERFSGEKNILSPSALNTYLDCPQKFYLHYVCKLREPDEVSTEIKASDFGSIFHRSTELIYEKFCRHGNLIRKEDIEQLLDKKNRWKIEECVHLAFKEVFFRIKNKNEEAEYNGMQLLNRAVITTYVEQLLRRDSEHAPFTFVESERKINRPVTLSVGRETFTINLGGSIDRLDSKEGVVRIIDYKTGSHVQKSASVEALFDPTDNERAYHIFQTMLYCMLYSDETSATITPALFYIQKAASQEYSPIISIGKDLVTDFSAYKAEFTDRLHTLLTELFSPDNRFLPTSVEKHCQYCEFAKLCGR